MSSARWKEHVLPERVKQDAVSESRVAFGARYSEIGFIAIAIEGNGGELEVGLSDTFEAEHGAEVLPSLPVMNFVTAVVEQRDSMFGGDGPPDDLTPKQVAEVLALRPCFLVPLRKRAEVDAAFRARISVGRARNMDIVLRHPSVSKFHAWFQIDELSVPYVTDGGSKNGTRVDGAQLAPKTPHQLGAGSRMHFGHVQAVYLPTELVYRVLRE